MIWHVDKLSFLAKTENRFLLWHSSLRFQMRFSGWQLEVCLPVGNEIYKECIVFMEDSKIPYCKFEFQVNGNVDFLQVCVGSTSEAEARVVCL